MFVISAKTGIQPFWWTGAELDPRLRGDDGLCKGSLGVKHLDWISAPAGPLRGELRVPGDKSVSHRAIMFASLRAMMAVAHLVRFSAARAVSCARRRALLDTPVTLTSERTRQAE